MNNSSKKIDSGLNTADEKGRKGHRGRERNSELDQEWERDNRRKKYSEGFNPEIKLDSNRPNNIHTNLSSLSSSFTSDLRNLKDTVDDKGRTPINHGLVECIIDPNENKSSMIENNKIAFEHSDKLAKALKINSNVNSTLNAGTKEKPAESKSEVAKCINENNASEIKEEVEIVSNEIKVDDGLGKVSLAKNLEPLVPFSQSNCEGSKVLNESVKTPTSLISNQENSSKTFVNMPKPETPEMQGTSLVDDLGSPLGGFGGNIGAEFKLSQSSQPTCSTTANPNNVNSSLLNNSNPFAISTGGVNTNNVDDLRNAETGCNNRNSLCKVI
jgi:hypothetical protein